MIILWTLTALAFGMVFLSLIMGAKNMGGKTDDARQKSNIWMRRRKACNSLPNKAIQNYLFDLGADLATPYTTQIT